MDLFGFLTRPRAFQLTRSTVRFYQRQRELVESGSDERYRDVNSPWTFSLSTCQRRVTCLAPTPDETPI